MALRGGELISIGQMAARTGLAVSAIRYYESEGLVLSERTLGGQRRYTRADIRRLSFVMIAQQFGFTIAEIREQLNLLPEARTPTKADWEKISRRFAHRLDEKIETLTQLRGKLDGCIGCGCLSLRKCTLYNPNDRAHTNGPGPRYLLGDWPQES